MATQHGYVEFLKLLIPEIDTSDLIPQYFGGGGTLVHEATKGGHAEIVEFLITHTKLLPTEKDDTGVTPLALAVKNGRAEIVKIIAKHLDEQDLVKITAKQHPFWITPIHKEGSNLIQIAAAKGFYKVLEELCQKVPNPNIPSSNGNTATHIAARKGHFEIVKLLTSYTSKSNTANDLGITPAGIARSNGFHEIANYLDRMARKRKFDELN